MDSIETQTGRVTVPIEKLVYGGEALARVDGRVMLVPFALPGEEIDARLERGKGAVLRGREPRVLKGSAHRVTPACEYFGSCGGCHYQHAEYGYQLEQKSAILRETLRRLGQISFSGEIKTVSGGPWGYRNRIQVHFDRGKLGYRRAESHELCPIDHCPISSPKLNEVIGHLTIGIRHPQWPEFLRSLEIFTNETDVQLSVIETGRPIAARFFEWCGEIIHGVVPGSLDYRAAGESFRISRGAFFQVNRFLIDDLVKEVIGGYEGTRAFDLYAGVGLFALPLSERFERVDAIERGRRAYEDLAWNAVGKSGTLFPLRALTEEWLADAESAPDLIVADPPRAGLGPATTRELFRIKAGRLVIVSCDPATLARDLKELTMAYEIKRLTMLDLFPQTFHLETVAHLELKH
jgi:23S rRNA (uracil1939-C5)-methyltransferase